MDALSHVAGSYIFDWDVNPAVSITECAVDKFLPENLILTTGNAIKFTELKVDPYEMSFSYGQFTRIKYSIERDALITVTVMSPNGTTATLENNQFRTAGTLHEVEWKGTSPSDSTGKQLSMAEEGYYLVTVQAVNPATGASSVKKRLLRVWY
jgi:hypothetical protein